MTKFDIINTMNYNVTNPDNIRLYHGTTFLGGTSIPKIGFKEAETTLWNCSEYDKVYFYELKEFMRVEGIEDYTLSDAQRSIIQRANENGQLQEAIMDSPNDYTCVLEFILPPEAKQFIEDDDSCENMSSYGAVQMDIDVINHFIKTNKCTINIYKVRFFPKMAYFYIAGLKDNEFATTYFEELSHEEAYAIKAIAEAETCCVFEYIVGEVEPEFLDYFGSFDTEYYR